MVGDGKFGAYLVAEVVIMIAVEDVVDAVGWEAVAEVGGAYTFAATSETVFKAVSNFVYAVGSGRVVEVTADDDRVFAGVDVCPNGLRLQLSALVSASDFVVQAGGFLVEVGVVADVVVQYRLTGGIVFLT